MSKDNVVKPVPKAEEIISALNMTGFVLEHRVAKVMRSKNFAVYIHAAFPDPETSVSREMDVRAILDLPVGNRPSYPTVCADLMIECKNNSDPFVIIGEQVQSDEYPFDLDPQVTFDPYKLGFSKNIRYATISYAIDLLRVPGSLPKASFLGYQLVKMYQKNSVWHAGNDSVYNSILYPLAKAWKHFSTEGFPDNDSPWEYPYVFYNFPIVVTSGPVFTANPSGDQIEICQVPWAPLVREFKSDGLSGRLRADIVAFDNLDFYLESRVLPILEGSRQAIMSNIHLYDPEWWLSNYGQPKRRGTFDKWLANIKSEKSRLGLPAIEKA